MDITKDPNYNPFRNVLTVEGEDGTWTAYNFGMYAIRAEGKTREEAIGNYVLNYAAMVHFVIDGKVGR